MSAMEGPDATGVVLVTGGAGFVGQAVCRELLAQGSRVLATWLHRAPPIDDPRCAWRRVDWEGKGGQSPFAGTARRVLCTNGDCPLFPDRFDAVIHAAACLPGDRADPAAVAQHNRAVDEAVFALAARRKALVVYLSSTSVYGRRIGPSPALAEDAGLTPASPYGEAKVWAEDRGRRYALDAGASFTALRVCAPYGPVQRRRTVVRIFLEQALAGRPIAYHGSGSRQQDFTFVDDIARACVLALRAPGGVFNIAGGAAVSMRELGLLAAAVAGRDAALVQPSGQDDPEEGAAATFDIRAAGTALGWRPQVALADGLRRTLDSMRREDAWTASP